MEMMDYVQLGISIVALIAGAAGFLMAKFAKLTPWKWDDQLSAFIQGAAEQFGMTPEDVMELGYNRLKDRYGEKPPAPPAA